MAGRPTKYTPKTREKLLRSLRNGLTRTAAAAAGGISHETFFSWMRQFPEFSESVTCAEGEAESRYSVILMKAAEGVPYERRTETVKTIIGTKKTANPDGTVVEEPVTIEDRTVQIVSGVEYDWKAAESWLKRRRRDEWGDNLNMGRLSDAELIALATGGFTGNGATGADNPKPSGSGAE